MSELSRRAFLRLGRSEGREPVTETPPSGQAVAKHSSPGLPRVIAWLDTSAEVGFEPPLPDRAPHAPMLRPPGSIAEPDFLKACTRCTDCRDACPHQAIGAAPPVFGIAAGTPRIDPSHAPCHLCSDFPCITACPTGALADDGDPMGTAWVQALDCLGALGTTCSVCQEHCPVDLAIVYAAGIPRIDTSLCVGCGKCHYACPAPNNAIAILPNAHRRTWRHGIPVKSRSTDE